ncbi:MAG: hypothetical protein IIA60_00550, partial [Candidatus Marinimicrobia bacterium]|nr:hypothetical protein [Candidatus Neomarinimicrobiota bacterium]
MNMKSLDNLLIVGVQSGPGMEFMSLKKDVSRYSLNIWSTNQPAAPLVIPIPCRGDGYRGGFNHITAQDHYLFAANGEGILTIDLTYPNRGYVEFTGVNEISEYLCNTSGYLISCLDNLIQVRSLDDITTALEGSNFGGMQINIPYHQLQHEGEGDTILALFPIPGLGEEYALLNNATDKSYLIDPQQGQCQPVRFSSKQQLPYTFQRREQFHFITTEPSKHLVFTESTSDDQQQNRVYSLDIRGPPTITELEPLDLNGRQILSMLPSENDQLTLQALEELGENPLGANLNVKAKETSQYEGIAAFLESESALRSGEEAPIIDKVNYFQ